MHLYVTVGECVLWPEGSWQRGLSYSYITLHSVLYNYHSQPRFTTVKPRLRGSTAQQHPHSSTLASCHAMPAAEFATKQMCSIENVYYKPQDVSMWSGLKISSLYQKVHCGSPRALFVWVCLFLRFHPAQLPDLFCN